MATIQERLAKMRQDTGGTPYSAMEPNRGSISQRLAAMQQDVQKQRQILPTPTYDPSRRFSSIFSEDDEKNTVKFPSAKDRYTASDVTDAENWLKTQSEKLSGTREELERRQSTWGDIRIAPSAADAQYDALTRRRDPLGLTTGNGKSYLDLAREYDTEREDFQRNYSAYERMLKQIEDNADDYAAQAGALEADAGKKRNAARSMQRMIDDGLISDESAEKLGYPAQISALLKEADELEAQAKPYRDTEKMIPGLRFQRKYGGLTDAKDFAEKSGYREELTEEGPSPNDLTRKWEFPLYEIVNGNDEARDAYTARRMNLYGGAFNPLGALWGGAADSAAEAQDMSEDEVALFNYIYHTQGREAAQEFYDDIKGDLNARRRLREQEEWGAYAKEKPFESSLFSVVESPLRGMSYLGQAADLLDDGKIDTNAGYNRFTQIPGDIRASIAKEIEDSGKWGKAGSFLYQTGMSMGDFLMSTAVSGGNEALSLAIMGTGAAADTVITAKERGLSDKQAFALGTVAGAAEVITEKVSLDALLDKTSLNRSAIGYFLKNVLAEGSEEVGSDVINLVADTLLAKDKSEWKTAMRKLREENPEMSEKQAFWRVFLDQAQQMGLDFAGGALSGGVMAGGSIAINASANYAAAAPERQTGRTNSAISDAYAAMEQSGMFSPQARAAAERADTQLRKTDGARIRAMPTQEEYDLDTIGAQYITRGPEAMSDLIEDGLASPEGSESRRIAIQLTAALESDEDINLAREIGRLHRALYGRTEGETRTALPALAPGESITGRMIRSVAADAEQLSALGIDPTGKSARAVRDEVRSALETLRDGGETAPPAGVRAEPGSGTMQTAQGAARDISPITRIAEAQKEQLRSMAKDGGLGEKGAEVLERFYTGERTPDYFGGFAAAYNAGTDGRALDTVQSALSQKLTPEQRQAAWEAGRMDAAAAAETKNAPTAQNAPERAANLMTGGQTYAEQTGPATAGRNGVSDGGGERDAGLRAGGEAESVGGGPRKAAPADMRTASQRHALIRDLRLQPADLRAEGVQNAENTGDTYILPEESWDGALRSIAENMKRGGVKTVFILGNISHRRSNGTMGHARGCYVAKTNTVYIQADGTTAPEQIAEHELWHARYNASPAQDRMLEERIRETYSAEAFEKVLDKYINAMYGVIDLHEGMTDEEYEAALNAIKNELFADAVSGLNGFGAGATQFTEAAQQFRDEYWGANPQTRSATEQTTGPPVQFSYDDGEIAAIQSVQEKSVNDLSSEELQSLQSIAGKYWKQMGVKSPFFRAWFGDWRANDRKTPVRVADQRGNQRGKQHNDDTGWDINVSRQVFNETSAHQLPYNKQARKYLPFINDIVKKAILMDSATMGGKTKSINSLLMHTLYAVGDIGDGPELLKLYVEEMNDPNAEDSAKRAYQLQNIESQQLSVTGSGNALAVSISTADIETIADLYEAVKAHDPNFSPKEPSKIINADGTPKVMYRGGSERIAVFDRKKSSPSNLYGRGFYFTDDETRAKQYGDARPYYLDAKNPLRPGQHSITRQQMRAFLDAVAENEDDYDFWNYGQRATVDSVLRDLYGKGDFEMLQDVSATAIGDLVAAVELFNSVNGTEYDGIDLPTETVMFESNRIKSADENAGTFGRENPNVFFSEETDTDELRQELRERGNVETRRALANESREAFNANEAERRRIRKEIRENESKPKEIAAVEKELAKLRDRDYQRQLLDSGGQDAIIQNAREVRRLEERLQRLKGEEPAAPKQPRKKAAKKANAPTISVRQLQNDLLRFFSVPEGQRAELGKFVANFANKIYREGKLTQSDYDTMLDRLYGAGVVTVPASEYQRAGRSAVKDGRIFVPDYVKAEFGDDWNRIRVRAMAAGVYLVNDSSARGADQWNTELAEMFPGIFSQDNLDQRSIIEQIVQLAEEGKDQKMSLADYTAMIAGQEYMTEDMLREGMERHIDWALRTFAEKAGLEVFLKDRTDAVVQQERAAAWERRQQEAERKRTDREIRELQQKTLKQLQWLSANRNKAPAELRQAFDDVLSDIDVYAASAANALNWSKRYQMTWRDLVDLYDAKTNKASPEYDENFFPSEEMKRIYERLRVKKQHIADMDLGTLQDLYKAAAGLRQEVYDRNNLINDEFSRTIAGAYYDSKAELEAAAKDQRKKNLLRKYDEMQLTPMNRFESMAGWKRNSTWASMARMLEKGERDQRRFTVNAKAMLADFLQQNQKWVARADGQGKDGIWYEVEFSPVAEWGEMDQPIFGDPVKVWMTPAMKVQLYLESKSEDNLRHMAGGRTFADKEFYARGERSEAYANGRTFKMTPEAVRKIVSDLTAEEKALADVLEQFYNEYSKAEINRVSNALYGYDKAMGRYYAPIFTDSNYTQSSPGVFDLTAEGVGNLKERKKSWTPSMMISAFDAFEKSVDKTAKFVGLAIPIRNMNTLWNWWEDGSSMKDVVEHAQGEQAAKFVEDLMTELQGNKELKHPQLEQLMDKALSKYVGAVFGFNPSIVLKQFASFPLAASYLGWGNMPKWIPGAAQVDRELIRQYSGELGYRNMGYATPETALLKDNPGLLQKKGIINFVFGGGAINWMDDFTVRSLWSWAENKVRKDQPNLRPGTQEEISAGTDAFYKAVASEFEEAVSRSQPMYDIMHRSQVMREGGGLARAFTMFKTVPQQEYNMIREAFGELAAAKASGDAETKRAASAKVGRAVSGVVVGNLMIGAITFLNALLKNKAKAYRDDDGELTPESAMKQFGLQFFRDSIGLAIGGDVIADVLGAAFGARWYGVDAPGVEQVNEILEGISNAGKNVQRLVKDSITIAANGGDWGKYMREHGFMYTMAVEDAVKLLGTYAGGLPVNNVRAYLLGALQWMSPEIKVAYEDAVKHADREGLKGLSGDALELRLDHILTERMGGSSDALTKELAGLYSAGYQAVVPTAVPSSVSIDNEKHELNLVQQQTYSSVWQSAVGESLEELIHSDAYQNADEKTQAAMIKKIYDYAAAEAKGAVFDEFDSTEANKRARAVMKAGATLEQFAVLSAEFSAIDADKSGTSAERGEQKREAILSMELTDQEKLDVYAAMSDAEKRSEKLQAIFNTGLRASRVFEIYDRYDEINNSGEAASVKAASFSKWIDEQRFTETQAEAIRDNLTFSAFIPASGGTYDKFAAAGLTPARSYQLFETLRELKPEEGANNVSEGQKLRAINDMAMSDEEKIKAFGVILGTDMVNESGNPTGYAKMLTALNEGVTIKSWLDLRDAGQVDGFLRYRAAAGGRNYGISPEIYITYRETLPQYDADGNNSYTQKEVQAALDGIRMGGSLLLGGGELTREQKAVLWQLANASWKPYKNPYDTGIGQAIYDGLHAEKETLTLKASGNPLLS